MCGNVTWIRTTQKRDFIFGPVRAQNMRSIRADAWKYKFELEKLAEHSIVNFRRVHDGI